MHFNFFFLPTHTHLPLYIYNPHFFILVKKKKLRSYDRGSMMNAWWSWTGYMMVPTRCVISKVQMIIPQNLNKSTAVQANNYDILVTNHPIPYTNEFKTSTYNGNIHVTD